MLALLHEVLQPFVDCIFQEFLDRLLGKGNVVRIFPILGVECENKRKIKLCCLTRRGLTEKDRMMRMDHIQLERGKQLIHKGGDRNGSRDISRQRQRQAGIAENERFGILVCAV